MIPTNAFYKFVLISRLFFHFRKHFFLYILIKIHVRKQFPFCVNGTDQYERNKKIHIIVPLCTIIIYK